MLKFFFRGCVAIILIAVILPCAACAAWQFYSAQQCLIPPTSYYVEVAVSACNDPLTISACCGPSVSPDGRYLYYVDNRGVWLRDLVTDTERKSPGITKYWLGAHLGLQIPYSTKPVPNLYLLDAMDLSLTPVQAIQNLNNESRPLSEGTFFIHSEVADLFREADQVYFLADQGLGIYTIALAHDFKAYPEKNHAITYQLTNTHDDERVKRLLLAFLQANHPNYHVLEGPSPRSHDGDYIVKDGEFVNKAGAIIAPLHAPRDMSEIAGWAYDDSGVYMYGYPPGNFSILPSPVQVLPILKIRSPRN